MGSTPAPEIVASTECTMSGEPEAVRKSAWLLAMTSLSLLALRTHSAGGVTTINLTPSVRESSGAMADVYDVVHIVSPIIVKSQYFW
jgi:hypothetical protein